MRNLPTLWNTERQDPIHTIRREMERFMNQVIPQLADAPSWLTSAPFSADKTFAPACDLEETGTHFMVSMDLPGIDQNDVHVEVDDQRIRIYGERKEEKRSSQSSSQRRERFHGAFERIIPIAAGIKTQEAQATFEKGVLKVILPKAQISQSRKIPIGKVSVQ